MDFTAEMSMTDIERQFDEYDELAGLNSFESDSEIMQSPEMAEFKRKSRRVLDLLSDDDSYSEYDDDWDDI